MKNRSLFLILLLAVFMPWAANAQTVTVCNGTDNSEKVPFDGWNADGAQHNQMIFPATGLTDMNGKSITQMVFYIDQNANNGTYTAADRLGTWTVSLGETTATTLTALDNTTTVTQVYQGYFDCSTGTLTLVFDDDYLYQGGNLLVDLNHAAASWNRWYFLGVNQTENTAITKGTLYKFLPKTTFTYQTPATCPKPTLSNTVTTTSTSATITWTPSNEDQTLFDIYWSTEDTAPTEATTPSAANQSGTSYTIGSLNPATQYYVWIRGNCGTASNPDISGGWTPKVSFLTDCALITTFPYTQNFDSYTPSVSYGTPSARTLPVCWSYINTCTYSTYMYYPTIYYYSYYPDYANSTPNSLRFYSQSDSYYDPQDQYAILPEMANLSGLRIKLYARAYSTSYDATFHVGVMTDPADVSTFVEIASKTPTTTSYEPYTISFSGYTGTGTYIAIKMDKATSSYRGVFIDDIIVEEIPSCVEPTDLTVVDVTTNSVQLNWTNGSNETAWDIFCTTDATIVPDDATTPTIANTSDKPCTVGGLSASSHYYAYIRSHCSATTQSVWSAVCEFDTECEPITITASNTLTEGFEDYAGTTYNANGVMPLCWDNYSTGSVAPHVIGSGSYYYVHTGTKALTFYGSGNCYAALPEFTNDLNDLQIDFWMRVESTSSGTLTLGYITAEDVNFNTFQVIDTYSNTGASSMVARHSYITAPATATRLVFRWYYGSQYSCCIDDVVVSLAPTCRPVSNLTCTTKTAHTATLSWTNGAEGQNAWQVAYSTDANFDPTSVTPVDVTENPGTISGLEANTTYYAYVRANCGDGDFSAWCATKVNFKTTSGIDYPTNLGVVSSSITSSEAQVRWKGVAANDLHQSYDVYYSRLNSRPDPLEADSLFTSITDTNYYFTRLDPETKYYVWVRDVCGEDGTSLWTPSSINFTTASACETPDGLAASNVTNEAATITWNTYGLNEFNLRYGTDGENWTVKSNVNTPYELIGLTGNTPYQVQVQATCNTAEWSTVFNFTTACDAVTTFPWGEDFESYTATTSTSGNNTYALSDNCWENSHISGNGSYLFMVTSSTQNGNSTKKLSLPDQSNGTMTKLRLPAMTLPNANYQFAIDVNRNTNTESYGEEGIRVFVSTNGEIEGATELAFISRNYTITDGGLIPAENTSGWYTYELPIGISGTCYIILRGENKFGSATYLDNFIVEEIPTCARPSGLAKSDVTNYSATLTWTPGEEGQTHWQIAYKNTSFNPNAIGFDLSTVTTLDIEANNTYTFNHTLTPNTTYYMYVRANCGDAVNPNYSKWCATGVNFTTKVATPAPSSFTASNPGPDCVDLVWNAGGGENESWDLYYVASETTPTETPDDDTEPSKTVSTLPTAQAPYTLTGLDDETKYYIWVRANYGTDGTSSWVGPRNFTTLEACPAPTSIAAGNLTQNTADLTWTGYSDSYNIKYNMGAYYDFFEGFENGLGSWTFISMNAVNGMGGSGTYPAGIYSAAAHNDSYGFRFSSYTQKGDSETYDQYLVSPELTVSGELKFYFKKGSTSTESLYVGYSTTTNDLGDVSAWTWTEDLEPTQTWQDHTLALPNDVKYIAFHYFGSYTYYVFIDDITIGEQHPAGASVDVTDHPTECAYTLTGLTAGRPYEVQIQGVCDGTPGNWSESISFTTLEPAVFTKPIEAYDTQNEKGWYLIASPLAGEVNLSDVAGLNNDGTFRLYRFNQSAELEWEYYGGESANNPFTTLVNGKGYLYANTTGEDLTFAGVPYSGDGVVDLVYDEEAAWSYVDGNNTIHYYWNLIGNPYGEDAYIDRPFYRMSAAGSEIMSAKPTDSIAPMEGVFVIAEGSNETLTFSTTSSSKGATLALNVTKGRSVIDRAIVNFGGGSTLPKFQLFGNSTKIYIPQDNKDYAVVNAEAQGEMPVNFKAEENGTYTLSFSNEEVTFSYLHLIDNMTGNDIDLLQTSSYTFNATTTDYESRFKLVFCTGSSTSSETFAFCNNGNWIIANEGRATLQVIDITGRILSSETVNGSVSKAIQAAPGVYVLRLINGDNVKVQKIVVR